MDNERPNPEALLASIQKDEARSGRGRLKIFFGMAPGVGKTYAMLREARREDKRGIDVVVGLVETHGRTETAAVLEGLVIAPRREVEYRGTVIPEMDLDAIVFLRPKLVVVDELAHSNAPGSRHPKRWQDVLELLDLGIDVFTTLNVQHVESRADTVRQLTGITVRETVPDSLLERADEIELIDLSPARLRERLVEGKVYLGNRAAAASENFFKEENLVALREIALRLTAERVDQQLRAMRRDGSRASILPSGRLMVAVGPSPYSMELVRRTRRLAYTLDVSWLVVSIDSGRPLSTEDQRQLDKNLALARELGAEVVFTRDDEIARALLRVARENHVTQLVIGRPMGRSWSEWLQGGSLLDKLLREAGTLDIHVVTPASESPGRKSSPPPSSTTSWNGYALSLTVILMTTGVNWGLSAFTGYWSLALFYLLAIVLLGSRLGRGPLLLAATLSALLWDFLFIPPIYTFYVGRLEDGIMLGLFFVVALVTGQLTSRLRTGERRERERERRASALYRLARSIGTAGSVDEVIAQASIQIRETFEVECAFYIADSEFGLPMTAHFASGLTLDEKEHAVAVWAYRNRRSAGRFTDTLASSTAFHIPLLTATRAYGVLAVKPAEDRQLRLDERDLVESFAQQIAMVLEKESLRAGAETGRILAQSEELYRSLFNSVSHELQTPLAVMQAALDELHRAGETRLAPVVEAMNEAMDRLKRLVKNLLDSARLETGRLEPKREWGEVRDLVDQAIEMVGAPLRAARVVLDVPENLPLLRVDFGLMSQALANVLHNSIVHVPPPVEIRLEAESTATSLVLRISDNGPGIRPELLDTIFDRFVRGPEARPGGSGLGLSIAKGFIEIHGGTIEALRAEGGGALFIIRLPLEKPSDWATLEP